ncbi:uncharacterized protein [Blastocystis hominis]|uniref:Uncharacterized protein n=1 Tax=Blastocystis hominis TaxID=12968 RepID=D8MAK9_BLAHO|nr:uncharacterized protein [Blastocystis hominis]CBK25098.2 unnamed protein product [Blastocystis hominis]|eukprot:XP_012899146.1 uncharacterized protein [Blastocystis hominis]
MNILGTFDSLVTSIEHVLLSRSVLFTFLERFRCSLLLYSEKARVEADLPARSRFGFVACVRRGAFQREVF